MDTRKKIVGIALASALTLSACGGASETEIALADQNNDLQAQIHQLEEQVTQNQTEEAPESAPTTTTAPTTEAPATTVAAKEPVEAPTTTVAVPEAVEEKVDAPSLALGAVFATPAAASIDATITPANAEAFFDSLVGPTNNFAGQMARLHVFPNVSTLPDTQVFSVSYVVDDSIANKSVRLESRFSTTATPADAVLAYQVELAELIGGNVTSATQEQDGTVFHVAAVGPFTVTGFTSNTGATFVEIEYATFVDGHDPLTTSSLAGLTDANVYDTESTLERITISHIFDTLTVGVDRQTEGATVAALDAAEAAYAGNNAWTLSRDLEFLTEYTSADIAGGTIQVANSIATRIGVEYGTSRIDYVYS